MADLLANIDCCAASLPWMPHYPGRDDHKRGPNHFCPLTQNGPRHDGRWPKRGEDACSYGVAAPTARRWPGPHLAGGVPTRPLSAGNRPWQGLCDRGASPARPPAKESGLRLARTSSCPLASRQQVVLRPRSVGDREVGEFRMDDQHAGPGARVRTRCPRRVY